MNKNELIDSMAAEAGMTKADAGKALDAFIASVTAALKKGDEIRLVGKGTRSYRQEDIDAIRLVGFGTFSVSKRAATTARNPRTGAEIKVAAKNVAKFKVGKSLQDALN